MATKLHRRLLDLIGLPVRSVLPVKDAGHLRAPRRPDASVLQAFSPLNKLKAESLSVLARETRIHALGAGQILFNKGDIDSSSFYLLAGSVELRDGDHVVEAISAGSLEACAALAPGASRRYSAWATSDIEYMPVNNDLLDALLFQDGTGTYEVSELRREAGDASDDWMTALLQKKSYHRIPPKNIQSLFMRMERIDYQADEVVAKQGTAGDYFYVVASGKCAVRRETPRNGTGIQVSELTTGDTFGEETLITGECHPETVIMRTNGTLMRLNASDFQSLLKEPLVQWVNRREARRILTTGGRWLDVRLPGKSSGATLGGAVRVPFYLLRKALSSLDRNIRYVVHSDMPGRSCAAAFILSERGFDAYVVKDGHASSGPALTGGA